MGATLSCLEEKECLHRYRCRGEMYRAEMEIKDIIEGDEELMKYYINKGRVRLSMLNIRDHESQKVYEKVVRHRHTPGSFVLCLWRAVCELQRVNPRDGLH